MAPGLGPIAEALTPTELPTVVSAGLAVAELHVAQLNVTPFTCADPASAAGWLHCIWTDTVVVVRAVTVNCAEAPVHVVIPSVVVPLNAIV